MMRNSRPVLACPILLGLVLALSACSNDEGDGATGGGGASSSSGADGGGGSTSSTGEASSTSTGGGDCGGATCSDTEICIHQPCDISTGDDVDVCIPRPTFCDEGGAPACGADGTVYPNECEALRAGVRPDDTSKCEPQEGLVGCGSSFCDPATELCVIPWSDCDDGPGPECRALPEDCLDAPACDCLSPGNCEVETCVEDGGLIVAECY